jgi:hypothetical protein
MKNAYFPDEELTPNDLFFVCSMIERVARHVKQPNRYVVNSLGREGLTHQLSVASVLHSENPLQVVDDWVSRYRLAPGDFDVCAVDPELCSQVPSPNDMGKVYMRLILQTRAEDEDYADGIVRVYNNPICDVINNYNCSAYYEPSYYIAQSYFAGEFV